MKPERKESMIRRYVAGHLYPQIKERMDPMRLNLDDSISTGLFGSKHRTVGTLREKIILRGN